MDKQVPATFRPIRTRRTTKLRVVSPDHGRPHPVAIQFGPLHDDDDDGAQAVGEIITFKEWAAIPAHQRPDAAVLIPGIGFIVLYLSAYGFKKGSSLWHDFQHANEARKAESALLFPD